MRHTLVFDVSTADLTQAGELMIEIFTNSTEPLDVTEANAALRTKPWNAWGPPIQGTQTS